MTLKPAPRDAILVVNTHSRKGEWLFAEARAKLEAAGVRLIASHAVHDHAVLTPTISDAVQGGAPMVIVGGGDGTLSRAVGSFVGHDCVFAPLPLGTANSFARTLGIPLDLDGAVHTIATGQRRRIDLGVIGGHYFTNAASLGLSPIIGETVPHRLKRYLGRFGYLLWAGWCLLRFRPFRLTVGDGTGATTMWATDVRILNGRYHSGVEFVERDTLASGTILLQAVTGKSVARLVWDWFAQVAHLPWRGASTQEFRAPWFRIETRPRLNVSVDGEVLVRTPATVECAVQPVEVLVPAGARRVPVGTAG